MSNVIDPESLRNSPALPILDVRLEVEFLAERIAEAVRVPIERWEAAAKSAPTGFHNNQILVSHTKQITA